MKLDSLFKKNTKAAKESDETTEETEGESGKGKKTYPVDLKKSRRMFDPAKKKADAFQYDYALELYISGLKFDPDNMNIHEAVYEIAKKRFTTGKKGGGGGGLSLDRSPVGRMLAAEHAWSKDFMNFSAMKKFFVAAADATVAYEELHMQEVANWIGELTLKQAKSNEKTKDKDFKELTEAFLKIGNYEYARDAFAIVFSHNRNSTELLNKLRDIEAQATVYRANMEEAAKSEDDRSFEKSVKNIDEQKIQQDVNAISKTEEQLQRLITEQRNLVSDKPEDVPVREKLVKYLKQLETDEGDAEAMALLQNLFDRTGEFKYKVQTGDIKMDSAKRKLDSLKKRIEEEPDDKRLKQQYTKLVEQRDRMELREYRTRVDNYPTDLPLKYELGKRLFSAKMIDEAIETFQDAQANPKLRPNAMQYLGVCYIQKKWLGEAIETFRRAIEAHHVPDDKLGLSLRFNLMDALERQAKAKNSLELAEEAAEVASFILQTNIKYKNIRDRKNGLQELVTRLS